MRSWLAPLPIAFAAASCLLVRDPDALSRGAGDAGDSDATDGDGGRVVDGGVGGDAGNGCPPAAPVAVVSATTPNGKTFAIDATEVTQRAYCAFLASKPDPATQSAACAWNTSFEPAKDGDAGGCAAATYDPHRTPDLPVSCVDWCDATAFCEAQGKRLCGHVDGGPIPYWAACCGSPNYAASYANVDQWVAACGALGGDYPYAGPYTPGLCNDVNAGRGGPVAVGSMRGCEGGLPGLFDMLGNVWEWEDSCEAGADPAATACATRGGSYAEPNPAFLGRCGLGGAPSQYPRFTRSSTAPNVGIRCCSR